MEVRPLQPQLRSARWLLATALGAGAVPDDPPGDAEVFNVVRRIQSQYADVERRDFHEAKRTFRGVISESVRGLDLASLSPSQATLIGPMLEGALDAEQERAFAESLERAAGDPHHGAAALLLLHALRITLGDTEHPELSRFLEHPVLPQTMNTWFGRRALRSFALEPEAMRRLLPRIEAAVLAIRPDAYDDPPSRPAVSRLLDAIDHPSVLDGNGERRDRIHRHLLSIARSTLSRCAPAGGLSFGPTERRIADAIDLVEYLESAASRDGIVDLPAPPLRFLWTSGPDASFGSLDDLRGRVVVLDFWATWCGPCVASFSKLRELQARVGDRGVAIVGVTSVQGNHVPIGGTPVDVEGRPEEEFDLMAAYAEENDVSWNVAFSDRSVIDPRYGVWGIPQIVLVDAGGVVRHAGLNPLRTDLETLVAFIEELLATSDGAR